MATYEVTGPDGNKYRVNGPDGASDADVLAQVQGHIQSEQSAKAPIAFDPSAGGGSLSIGPFDTGIQTPEWLDRTLAGAGAGLTNLAQGVKQRFGGASTADVAQKRRTDAPLMETTAGKVGDVIGSALPAVPAMMVPGVNSVVGASALGALQGLAQPTGAGESATRNALEGAALGGVGQKAGNMLGGFLANRAASQAADLAAQRTANTVRDSTLKAAQDAGYVLPPSQVNPSLANRFLEGFAGKLTTAQQAAKQNQGVTNSLVKADLGIPAESPLTLDTIRQARSDAAQAYAPIRNFGQINADPEYAQALNDLATAYDKSHGGMSALRNKSVESLFRDASKLNLDSNSALELVRSLREQGFQNAGPLANATDKRIGSTQLGIANAVENLIDRNLTAAGQGDAVQAFRAARQQIAKTYDAEAALNPSTGNIQANKLAAKLRKERPLTGGLRTVAEAGAAFPKATQEITTSLPGISPLDYMGGVLAGSAFNPMAFAAPFARPAVRAGILSAPFQKAMVQPPSYEAGLLTKLLASNPQKTRELLGLLGGAEAPRLPQ